MSVTDDPAALAATLATFRTRLRGIPFPVVIDALAGRRVIPIDRADPADRALIGALERAARRVGSAVRAAPIRRNRPNEVGNDIEPFVMDAIAAEGLKAERPRAEGGRGQLTGYPDILVFDGAGRPTYVECKVFGEDNALSTMRSFYLSPSDTFKVCHDARHLLMAFAIDRHPIDGSRDSDFHATAFRLLDLHDLPCDVKYEVNSDNRRLYDAGLLLAAGEV